MKIDGIKYFNDFKEKEEKDYNDLYLSFNPYFPELKRYVFVPFISVFGVTYFYTQLRNQINKDFNKEFSQFKDQITISLSYYMGDLVICICENPPFKEQMQIQIVKSFMTYSTETSHYNITERGKSLLMNLNIKEIELKNFIYIQSDKVKKSEKKLKEINKDLYDTLKMTKWNK
jgi:hypothetical protein